MLIAPTIVMIVTPVVILIVPSVTTLMKFKVYIHVIVTTMITLNMKGKVLLFFESSSLPTFIEVGSSLHLISHIKSHK